MPCLRWGLRLLGGLLALLLVLLLALWLVLPRWLQGSGARLIGEALGREVTIAEASFQPWRLGLTLAGVKIAGASGGEPLLTLERADAALSLRSVWHFSPVLESLTLTKPVLRLARVSPGRYDVDDLLARFGSSKPSTAPEAPPPALALYNIRLNEGQVLFEDRPAAQRHSLTALQLSLPFLSTLDADVKVHVEPELSGQLNGVGFGTRARVLPFSDRRETSLDFSLKNLDLARYKSYLPASLPLQLQSGLVDLELALAFSQAPKQTPQLQLRGELGLREVALHTPAGASWLGWRVLRIPLKDVQPLRRQLLLGAIRWEGLQLALQRDARGQLWLPAAAATGTGTADDSKAGSPAWQFGFEGFELSAAQLDWRDASVRPRANLKLDEIGLQLGALQWPLQAEAATALRFGGRLQPEAGSGRLLPARLSGEGSLAVAQLALKWQWQDLALEWFSPYLQAQAPVQMRGLLAGAGALSLAEPLKPDAAARAQLALRELSLKNLALSAPEARQPILSLATLALDELTLDLGARRLALGELSLGQPNLQLTRAADGSWSHAALLPPASAAPAAAGAPAPAWALQLRGLSLDRGSVRLNDAAVAGKAALAADQIKLRVQNLAWPATAALMPAQLSLKFGAAPTRQQARPQGSVQWQGRLGLAPLQASGKLRIERLPLQVLDPYLDPGWGLHLQQAELGLKSDFSLRRQGEGWQAQASADVLLADLLLQQARQIEGRRVVGEDLLSWQALNLDGLKLALAPGTAPRLQVADARLSDFYARLIVDEQGRFNLRDLGPQERAEKAAVAAVAAADSAASSSPPLALAIAQTRVSNGRVDFSDRFVRPNYSARLSELQGSLGAFSSERSEMAALSVKGKVAGTGLLDISGQLKPGAPLAMDIKAEASDIELAPLSPYAAKYAGYAIERGKFTTRVQYKIDPGGALQANNQIILNQLTFGDKVDSPDATKLPVLFAVALLKDRDGVIDVNLPISGSVNDPEFSVGGLVLKLILNLLGKALTAPFSLFSGGEGGDLSQAQFAPGSPVPQAPEQLDKVARMLGERPGLSLTITGRADAAAERGALQVRQLDAAMLAERRRELQRLQTAAGNAAAADTALVLSEAEQARLLKIVYQNTKLPNKPRNLIGLAKDLPPAEMRSLLLASYGVSEEAVRQLALERGVAVRDALIAKGIPNSRLFLATPRLQRAAGDKAGDGAVWTPHADLTLSAH